MRNFKIKKSNGHYQDFSKRKLERSLLRSGASRENAQYISEMITSEVKDGLSSRKIYRKAFHMLKKIESGRVVLRYSIRKAINDLGPSGFPFEKFVSGIYKSLGWTKIQTGVKVKGECVNHEVDLVGEKDGKKIVGELKFHNKNKIKTDLKVVLYVKERNDDLQRAGFFEDKKPVKALITNTRFSDNVKKFGKCTGMKIISWDYPQNYNLHDMVVESGLHPVTCLNSINKKQKIDLSDRGYVFCYQVKKMKEKDFDNMKSFSKHDIIKLMKESKEICDCKK